ncbi:MAG TPA: OmpA family protein [Chryseosolibacter sp.]|nr:OmpA family protein [Chryseosolibacter sp.]
MGTKGFFALAGILLICGGASRAQLPDPHSNYVVIGAFSYKQNAERFVRGARRRALDAKYHLNANRNLYYVYVLSSEDKERARQEANRLRAETEYFDTWVFNASARQIEYRNDYADSPLIIHTPGAVTAGSMPQLPQLSTELTEQPAEKNALKKGSLQKTIPGSKSFVFRVVRASDQRPLSGKVHVIEPPKNKPVGSYEVNQPVNIKLTQGKSGQVSAVCKLFGYREAIKSFNMDNPEQDGVTIDEFGNYVVPFELVRLQRGDIAVMYNVFFYKDAGIIRPESRFEVNELVRMLQENPRYRIKIHGHTNGNSAGRIISLKDNSDCFNLSNGKEGFGTARKLSYERANVIRQYLIASGITEDRMQLKAWGGKLPLYDRHHSRAAENVRVEVEILAD